MAFKKGIDRDQVLLFPESLDEYVSEDSPVRLIDAFVERLNLAALNLQGIESKEMGRPSYNPKDLLKVLIYGYFYGARSSRRMERECKVNVEVMWLTGKLTPDHNTLSEFRKKNIKCMKPMFREFNKFCLDLNMFSLDYVSSVAQSGADSASSPAARPAAAAAGAPGAEASSGQPGNTAA